MDSVGRLLLRFILVPLAYVVAVLAGTMVILAHAWNLGQAVTAHADAQAVAAFWFLFAAPVLLLLLLNVMWLPASVGVLISEAFAIRSWMFHAGNGAASALIGWSLFGFVDDTRIPLNHPLAVIAAGLAGRLRLSLLSLSLFSLSLFSLSLSSLSSLSLSLSLSLSSLSSLLFSLSSVRSRLSWSRSPLPQRSCRVSPSDRTSTSSSPACSSIRNAGVFGAGSIPPTCSRAMPPCGWWRWWRPPP